MNTLRSFALLAAMSLATTQAAATVIPASTWWDTDGFKQSTTDPEFYFAVSHSEIWDPNATYEAMAGFRVATTAEGQAAFTDAFDRNQPWTMYDQGGFVGYQWKGSFRQYFRFSDSGTTDAYKHVGQKEGYPVAFSSATNRFAGLVLVRDASNTGSVPSPAAFTLLLLGLASAALRRRARR